MTVEQAAQNLGVSAETLVREVVAKQMTGGILLTALFVAIVLGAIVAMVKMVRKRHGMLCRLLLRSLV